MVERKHSRGGAPRHLGVLLLLLALPVIPFSRAAGSPDPVSMDCCCSKNLPAKCQEVPDTSEECACVPCATTSPRPPVTSAAALGPVLTPPAALWTLEISNTRAPRLAVKPPSPPPRGMGQSC